MPAQGLYLLNNPFVLRAADATADLLLKGKEAEAERVGVAYARFFARPPTDKEQVRAEKFLAAYRTQLTKDGVPTTRHDREAWSAFCQALFASAEFQYRK